MELYLLYRTIGILFIYKEGELMELSKLLKSTDRNQAWHVEIDGWGIYNIAEPLYTEEQIRNFKVIKVIDASKDMPPTENAIDYFL